MLSKFIYYFSENFAKLRHPTLFCEPDPDIFFLVQQLVLNQNRQKITRSQQIIENWKTLFEFSSNYQVIKNPEYRNNESS